MSTIYQLYGKGESIMGWEFKMRSREVWAHKEQAEARIDDFTRKCEDKQRYFDAVVPGTLVVSILELELVDGKN